eukprot:gene15175-biopygen5174
MAGSLKSYIIVRSLWKASFGPHSFLWFAQLPLVRTALERQAPLRARDRARGGSPPPRLEWLPVRNDSARTRGAIRAWPARPPFGGADRARLLAVAAWAWSTLHLPHAGRGGGRSEGEVEIDVTNEVPL